MEVKQPLHQLINELFKALDAVKCSETVLLKSEESKERYETRVMFAYRKLEAARYHLDNVRCLDESASEELDLAEPPDIAPATAGSTVSGARARLAIQRPAIKYAFELSACLTAIKSCLDFLTQACATHLTGIDADSVQKLIRLVEKGKTGPFLDEIAENLVWLEQVREYRHHLVHRLSIVPTSGWTIETVGGRVVRCRLPVLVPETTPKFVPDTRRVRLMEQELPSGIGESYSEAWVTYQDGTRRLLQSSRRYEIMPGFVPIDDFMRNHITALEVFFEKIVLRLLEIDFNPVLVP